MQNWLPPTQPATLQQWLLWSLGWTVGSVLASASWLGFTLWAGFWQLGEAAGLTLGLLGSGLGCRLMWRRAIWSFHPLIEEPPPGMPWWLPLLATTWWIVLVLLGVGWLLFEALLFLLALASLVDNQGFRFG